MKNTRAVIVLVCLSAFIGFIPSIWADPIIDQSFIDPNSSSAAFFQSFELGQTFTAGVTGELIGVNLNFSTTGAGTLDVSIRSVDAAGAPTSTILGSTTITTSGNTYFLLSEFIGFPSAIASVAGQQYAIVITAETIYNGAWFGYHEDSYAGGKQWANFGGSGWYHYEDPYDDPPRSWDLNFRTHVIPTPEPGILILLGISMASVVGLKRWWKE